MSETVLSGTDLPLAAHHVFETCELFHANGSARVHLARRNADFRAHAELAAIGELRRCVMQDNCRIDLSKEGVGHVLIVSNDAVGMGRTVAPDMGDGCVRSIHHFDGNDRVKLFGAPVLLVSGFYAGVGGLCLLIAAHLASGLKQRAHQRLEVGVRA